MSTRRESREWALQILFQQDLNFNKNLQELFLAFWRDKNADKKSKAYSELLVTGVCEHIEEIDTLLQKYAKNWDIARMGVIDRNVLRLAMYELQYSDDIPPIVVINEAVDIAKYFSSTDSGKFVNGILDRVHKDQ